MNEYKETTDELVFEQGEAREVGLSENSAIFVSGTRERNLVLDISEETLTPTYKVPPPKLLPTLVFLLPLLVVVACIIESGKKPMIQEGLGEASEPLRKGIEQESKKLEESPDAKDRTVWDEEALEKEGIVKVEDGAATDVVPSLKAYPEDRPVSSIQVEVVSSDHVLKAERFIKDTLNEAQDIVFSLPQQCPKRWVLKENLAELRARQLTHSLQLMRVQHINEFAMQYAAFKAICLYMEQLWQVKSSIDAIRYHLLRVFKTPTTLEEIIGAYISVPKTVVQMGEFSERQPFTPEERESFLSKEGKRYVSDDKSRATELSERLGPFMDELLHDPYTEPLRKALKKLEKLGADLRSAGLAAECVMKKAFEQFPSNSIRTKAAVNMYVDLLHALSAMYTKEIEIWGRIVRGKEPLATRDIYRYHDTVIVANITYDSYLRLREHSLIRRDLIKALYPRPTLRSSELSVLESLRRNFIKWGGCLVGIAMKDAMLGKSASVRKVDFSGLMWRPFADSWLLRDEEQRRLIARTNQSILGREDKPYAFDEAMEFVRALNRPSLDIVPNGYRDFPEESEVLSRD